MPSSNKRRKSRGGSRLSEFAFTPTHPKKIREEEEEAEAEEEGEEENENENNSSNCCFSLEDEALLVEEEYMCFQGKTSTSLVDSFWPGMLLWANLLYSALRFLFRLLLLLPLKALLYLFFGWYIHLYRQNQQLSDRVVRLERRLKNIEHDVKRLRQQRKKWLRKPMLEFQQRLADDMAEQLATLQRGHRREKRAASMSSASLSVSASTTTEQTLPPMMAPPPPPPPLPKLPSSASLDPSAAIQKAIARNKGRTKGADKENAEGPVVPLLSLKDLQSIKLRSNSARTLTPRVAKEGGPRAPTLAEITNIQLRRTPRLDLTHKNVSTAKSSPPAALSFRLKRVEGVRRSPGGTPLRTKEERAAMVNPNNSSECFANALRKKFQQTKVHTPPQSPYNSPMASPSALTNLVSRSPLSAL
ncbi:Proline rich 11 [Balamuthia mandrillaris]